MEKKIMKSNSKFFLINLIVSLILSGTFFPVISFDHSHLGFDLLLKKHVKNGMVDYKGIKIEEEKLNIYLSELSSVSLKDYSAFTKEEKLSFLINAYNAFTIKLILDNYPLKSIRKIGFLPGAAWKTDFFSLLGEKRNLDWIEHSKLRVDFEEPRIHFAIVCASIGCPPLASSAYIPKSLNSQLQSSMEIFLADKSKNRYDTSLNTLFISKIFDWFVGDFTKNSSLISFIKSGMKIEIPENANINYTNYNWDLNEKK
jgi:hypothetical protein